MVMAYGNTLILLLSFVCLSLAELETTGDNELDNAEQLLIRMTTTEELVDLICSCRDKDNGDVAPTTDIDPLNLSPKPIDCYDILKMGQTTTGRYDIYPFNTGVSSEAVRVWCDMDTDGGGWTVFQRRQDGSVNFNVTWEDYKCGFGYIGSEFWLGNENVHVITNQKEYELLVEIEEYDGYHHVHNFDHFRLADETRKYALHTGTYTGTEDVCVDPLGMESGQITNGQITASTEDGGAAYKAIKARLNLTSGSWYAGTHDANQWVQVNFGVPKLVTGVVLQGRYNAGHWVTKYKVQYSNSSASWQYVKDVNQQDDMVFDGCTDQHTPVTSYFDAIPIKATYIRILPTAWHVRVTMRFELLGCEGNFLAYQNNQAFSTNDADNDAVADDSCAINSGAWWYRTCEHSDLNRAYLQGAGATNRGIKWKDFDGQVYSIRRTEMKIRPAARESSANVG